MASLGLSPVGRGGRPARHYWSVSSS